MTIETKIAKNGAVNFYANGKRTSRAKAIEIATANRQGAPFTVVYFAYNTKVGNVTENTITVGNLVISVASKAHRYDMFFEVMIDNVRVAFTGGYKTDATAVKNAKVNANVIANAIVAAYINGATGVKIVAGNVEILSAAEENDVEDELIDEPEITAKTATVEAEITADNNVNVEKNGTQMVIIPIADYNTCLTWAEKISNGQLDTVTQIATHIKKWFDADINKAAIIDTIKADDLNGFRKFLAQFNFLVKDDAGYLHKLYSYNDECVLAEIPTSEYSNAETEAANVETIPAEGMYTVTIADDTVTFLNGNFYSVFSAKYHAALVHKLNGIISYRLCNSEKENNFEYEVSYANFIRTLAERSAIFDDKPATCTPAPGKGKTTLGGDNEHFSNKTLATFMPDAERFSAAYVEWKNADTPKSDRDIADALSRELYAVTRRADYMNVTLQSGKQIPTCFGNAFVEPDWNSDNGFVFTNGHETFARYDTPEQVKAVADKLKAAIESGATEFAFPTFSQSAEPAIVEDSLTREELDKQWALYRAGGEAFYALNLALRGVPFGAERKQVKKTLDVAFNHFNERARAFEDDATEIYGKLEEQAQQAAGERLHKVSAQVKAMLDAAIDKAQVETTMPATVGDDVQYIATQITYPNGHEGEPTREVSKTFYYLDDAAKFIANDNPFIEAETGYSTLAYDGYYFGGVYWAGWKIEATDGRLICRADNDGVYGDQNICALVDKYIDANEIEDSLTRAMKIALDCYKGFCYVGNLTAAESELKLYNICRKAMTELRKER